jgi:arsenite methyltransferase
MGMKDDEARKVVRKAYARIAKQDSFCCSPASSCCGSVKTKEDVSRMIGYSKQELETVPRGANLGLGCGNPLALAALREGETVLDLGSGTGFDCFLAAKKVGKSGRIVGVDMTPDMIDKARTNAKKGNYGNVEFRLGEIENLPVPDKSIDIIISNCVINLSPDKERVFREAFRVLRPGGRLMISDLALLKEIPESIRNSVGAYVGCISGAILKSEYIAIVKSAGFHGVKIVDEKLFPIELMVDDSSAKTVIKDLNLSPEEVTTIGGAVVSIKIQGFRP